MNWDFVDRYRDETPPWGPIGYITYKRSYARRLDTGGTEEWWQTIHRCVKSLVEDLDADLTQEDVETLFYYVFNLKCCFAGRALWQLGTPTIRKVGANSLQNCWHVAIDEPIKPFTFAFEQLMLGGGVGFNIQAEHVYSIPRIRHDPKIIRHDNHDVDFIVPDNREGWIELLERVLHAYFFNGRDMTYSCVAVRDKGAKINGFGGVASGPEELARGIGLISKILSSRYGQKLRPEDCLDIMNIIGMIVVSGNVRRSAQMAIGDASDVGFLNSKAWGRRKIPNWRSMSNNTVSCDDINALPELFWRNYTDRTNGIADSECFGLVNLHNARRFGRLADGEDYRPDPLVVGLNPCGEITLESYEACNIFDIFLPNLEDEDEFLTAARLGYLVTKSISRLPTNDRRVNEVVSRNHRLGIGVTGFLQASHLRSETIFNRVYRSLEELDKAYSRRWGCAESVKLTTVKPSGTLSLLAGVTAGVHPAYASHYIRRIRFAANDPLIPVCERHRFPVEPQLNFDGTPNYETLVVSFPCASEAITAKQVDAITQLEYQKWLQTNWSDNGVSCTVYFHDSELPGIRAWLLRQYPEAVKSISFLRHTAHGFVQAPYEEISKDEYERLVATVEPISKITENDQNSPITEECDSGGCPIR